MMQVMFCQFGLKRLAWVLPMLLLVADVCPVLLAQEGATDQAEAIDDRRNEFAARRLLRQAEDALSVAGDEERGVKMLETIVAQYPETDTRFAAHLRLARYFLEQAQFPKAEAQLKSMRLLERRENLAGDLLDQYIESLYLTGVMYYQQQNYTAAFPALRKITSDYPHTVWANQAYYYIGMSHFMQRNWERAIQNLNLVGTFIDEDSPTAKYAEAGRRFYVKVQDTDLPVLRRLGKTTTVVVQTSQGDRVTVELTPLSEQQGIFIGSVATEIGQPVPNDQKLQVLGGDRITTRYVDANTETGEANVARESTVEVVSTGSVSLTQGTYEGQAVAAFLNQPLFVLVKDADLDLDDKAQEVNVNVISRYRVDDTDQPLDFASIDDTGDTRWETRDEVTLTLKELGDSPVRSGRFGGSLMVREHTGETAADKTDSDLAVRLGDQVVVTYVDGFHIAGTSTREVQASIEVAGTVETRPRARQNVVSDAVLRSRKNLVEAEAYLELTRIFRSMGLMDGARDKAEQGLDRVELVIREQQIPDELRAKGFQIKWQLHQEVEDYEQAIATIQLFHRMFPKSTLVDQAMLSIASIKLEQNEFNEAIAIYRQILKMESSQAHAEAQFMIGETLVAQYKHGLDQLKSQGKDVDAGAWDKTPEAAIIEYRKVSKQYRDSAFAGQALGKEIRHYIETKDLVQANELLERVFEDYPDAQFLDEMLLQWVTVSYQMGDYAKAYEKCQQLLVEFPNSKYAKTAQTYLPRIKQVMEQQGS